VGKPKRSRNIIRSTMEAWRQESFTFTTDLNKSRAGREM
jgi:hypothetical protein